MCTTQVFEKKETSTSIDIDWVKEKQISYYLSSNQKEIQFIPKTELAMSEKSEIRTQNSSKRAQSTPMNECDSVLSKPPEMGISVVQDKVVIHVFYIICHNHENCISSHTKLQINEEKSHFLVLSATKR